MMKPLTEETERKKEWQELTPDKAPKLKIKYMVIIIGNQKGGSGKSTLTMLLANYLTTGKGYDVTVLDMDYQRSIFQKFEKAKILENEEPYEVIEADLEYFPSIFKILTQKTDKIILIDLPGKLDDNALIPVLQGADLILTPFAYEEFTFTSTVMFGLVLRKLNPNAGLYFVPNRIKSNVKYEGKEEMENELSKIGQITAPIPEKIDFQRTTTFNTPLSLLSSIMPIFEGIIKDKITPVLGEPRKEVQNG